MQLCLRLFKYFWETSLLFRACKQEFWSVFVMFEIDHLASLTTGNRFVSMRLNDIISDSYSVLVSSCIQSIVHGSVYEEACTLSEPVSCLHYRGYKSNSHGLYLCFCLGGDHIIYHITLLAVRAKHHIWWSACWIYQNSSF